MTVQTAATFHALGAGAMVGLGMAPRCTCAVQLFDRRTGRAHRINGTPLVIYTRDPATAEADLLADRDPRIWEVRIEAIETRRAS